MQLTITCQEGVVRSDVDLNINYEPDYSQPICVYLGPPPIFGRLTPLNNACLSIIFLNHEQPLTLEQQMY